MTFEVPFRYVVQLHLNQVTGVRQLHNSYSGLATVTSIVRPLKVAGLSSRVFVGVVTLNRLNYIGVVSRYTNIVQIMQLLTIDSVGLLC